MDINHSANIRPVSMNDRECAIAELRAVGRVDLDVYLKRIRPGRLLRVPGFKQRVVSRGLLPTRPGLLLSGRRKPVSGG